MIQIGSLPSSRVPLRTFSFGHLHTGHLRATLVHVVAARNISTRLNESSEDNAGSCPVRVSSRRARTTKRTCRVAWERRHQGAAKHPSSRSARTASIVARQLVVRLSSWEQHRRTRTHRKTQTKTCAGMWKLLNHGHEFSTGGLVDVGEEICSL